MQPSIKLESTGTRGLITVQPLNPPSGLLYLMDYKYESIKTPDLYSDLDQTFNQQDNILNPPKKIISNTILANPL